MGFHKKHRILLALFFLILGILVKEHFEVSVLVVLFLAFISVISVLLKRELIVIAFFPAALLLSMDADYSPHLPTEFLNTKVTVSGNLTENPEKRLNSWRYIIDVDKISNESVEKNSDFKLVLYSKESVPNLYRGSSVKVYNVQLEDIKEFKNPGSFSLKDHFNAKGIYYSTFVNNPLNIQPEALNQNTNYLIFRLSKFRKNYENFVRKTLPEPQDEIINAITVGVKGAVPEKIRNNFSKLGISHLLAISGLHIGALAVFIYFSIKWILKRSEYLLLTCEVPKIASILTIIPLLLFVALAGFANPVLRAFIMISIYIIALFFNKDEDKLNILAAAAIIILIFSPSSLYELSFQLSFIAVSGIVVFHKIFPFKLNTIKDKLSSMLKTTIAASLFTLPLVINNFGYFPVATIPANLIAVPLVEIFAVPLGLLSIILFPISKTACEYILSANSKIMEFLLYFADYMLSFKYSEVTVPNIGITGYVFFCITIIFILANIYSKKFKYLAISAFLGFALTFFINPETTSSENSFEISFLDTGNKSYNLVTLPGNKTILITGGYSYYSKSDFAEKAGVIPFLLKKGIKKLDYLWILANDTSHFKGARAIAKRIDIKNIWTNGSKLEGRLWEVIREKNISWKNTREETGPLYFGDTKVSFIKPYVKDNLWNSRQPRAQLITIKNDYHKILIGEGIEKPHVQKELKEFYKDRIDSDAVFIREVYKMDRNFNEFIEIIGPKYMILNKPAGKIKIDMENIYVTSTDGMVSLTSDQKSLTSSSYN